MFSRKIDGSFSQFYPFSDCFILGEIVFRRSKDIFVFLYSFSDTTSPEVISIATIKQRRSAVRGKIFAEEANQPGAMRYFVFGEHRIVRRSSRIDSDDKTFFSFISGHDSRAVKKLFAGFMQILNANIAAIGQFEPRTKRIGGNHSSAWFSLNENVAFFVQTENDIFRVSRLRFHQISPRRDMHGPDISGLGSLNCLANCRSVIGNSIAFCSKIFDVEFSGFFRIGKSAENNDLLFHSGNQFFPIFQSDGEALWFIFQIKMCRPLE